MTFKNYVQVMKCKFGEPNCFRKYIPEGSRKTSWIIFFFKDFSWCGLLLKSLLNLLQYCFCFMLWFFGHKACGISAPRPGIKSAPPAMEGEVLTTGLPGKSLSWIFLTWEWRGWEKKKQMVFSNRSSF